MRRGGAHTLSWLRCVPGCLPHGPPGLTLRSKAHTRLVSFGIFNHFFLRTAFNGPGGVLTFGDFLVCGWDPTPDSAGAQRNVMAGTTDQKGLGSRTSDKLGFYWIWRWEAIGGFVSFVAVLAMVATLRPHDGQILPDWPFKISINSLLAIYGAILKSSILFVVSSGILQLQWAWFSSGRGKSLFDLVYFSDAARGPLGSLVWLCSPGHHFRQPLTALGALITIACLFLDPLVQVCSGLMLVQHMGTLMKWGSPNQQQLVRPMDCNLPYRGSVSLARTNRFELSAINKTNFNIVPQLQTAVSLGTLSPGTNQDVQCATGNCTFPDPYWTLGVCSSCTDISDTINSVIQCIAWENGTVTSETQEDYGCPAGTYGIIKTSFGNNYTSTYYPLDPSNGVPDEYMTVGKIKGLGSSFVGGSAMSVLVMLGRTSPASREDARNPFTREAWEVCDAATEESNTWACGGYGAANCTLQLCARSYTANVTNGQLYETLNSTPVMLGLYDQKSVLEKMRDVLEGMAKTNNQTSNASLSNSTARFRNQSSTAYLFNNTVRNHLENGLVDTECITASEKALLEQQGLINSTANGTSRWVPIFLNGTSTATITTSDTMQSLLSRECLYSYQLTGGAFLEDLLKEGFTGNLSVSYSHISQAFVTADGVEVYDAGIPTLANVAGSDFLQHVYNYADTSFERVESTMNNVSESLTQFIRTHGTDGFSEPVEGDVLHYAICLEVRWGWVAYPALLVVATIAHFVLVLATTVALEIPAWKGSTLAWLFRGPGGLETTGPGNGREKFGGRAMPPAITKDEMEIRSKDMVVELVKGPEPFVRFADTHMYAGNATGYARLRPLSLRPHSNGWVRGRDQHQSVYGSSTELGLVKASYNGIPRVESSRPVSPVSDGSSESDEEEKAADAV